MKSPLPYFGGKTRPAKKLIEEFPPHQTFVDLFCGGASILFAKEPFGVEIINDLYDEIPNLFRVVQFHPEELIRQGKHAVASRSWFDLLKKTEPGTLTDIQRAFRTLYLQKNSFGARVLNPSFHYFRQGRSNFNPENMCKHIEEAHKRLARVQIECAPYQQILKRYDTAQTFFFCDPPYYKKPFYKLNFSHDDYVEMAALLKSIQGKFLLTLNDVPEVRQIFAKFRISTITFPYTCLQQKGRRFTELVIKNY